MNPDPWTSYQASIRFDPELEQLLNVIVKQSQEQKSAAPVGTAPSVLMVWRTRRTLVSGAFCTVWWRWAGWRGLPWEMGQNPENAAGCMCRLVLRGLENLRRTCKEMIMYINCTWSEFDSCQLIILFKWNTVWGSFTGVWRSSGQEMKRN